MTLATRQTWAAFQTSSMAARRSFRYTQQRPRRKALDLGCAVGRATFELAKEFELVTGIDFSARFIRVALQLKENGVAHYELVEEGEVVSYHEARLSEWGLDPVADRVEFFQGDATNLKPQFTGYDLVLAANLIDRLYDPRRFLETIHERLNPGGVLVITSPYTWLEECTKKENWLGGVRQAGEPYWTLDALREILSRQFELPVGDSNKLDRWRGALWGMFVGDALAMPVHWYYDVAALQRDFGVVRDFQAPRGFHPSSIMSLASTGGAGRGCQEGEVVGSIILHGKKHLWGRPNRHYHEGLQSGDNTLNLLCVRVLLRSINKTGRNDPGDFLSDYIAFMTTPDSHRDTYAESYHRAFFGNYARGIAPDRCVGAENHDTASIGGLVGLPPVIMAALREDNAAAVDRTLLAHLRLTHRSTKLERYALALGQLLPRLLRDQEPRIGPLVCDIAESLGFPAAKVVEQVIRDRRSDLHVIGGLLSPACYIEHSFPAVLYLAARYSDDFEAALVANTNVGGDNCHRGAVLGALLGAALGYQAIPERWIRGLRSRVELEEEIESFLAKRQP